MGQAKNITFEGGKLKKKEENWCTSKKHQSWLIRGISLFIVLISIIITLWHCLGDVKRHHHEPVPTTNRILDIDILQWRFPNANFESCCSTIEKKKLYLKNCNMIFNQENIKCFKLYQGSIIVYLESTRIDFEKGVFNALFGINDIGGYSTKGHHKYEGIQIIKPKPFIPKKKHDEVEFTPGTYVVTNAKGARSCVGTSRLYPKTTKLKIIKIKNVYLEDQLRGQIKIKNSFDWVLMQNTGTGEIFMKRIKSISKKEQETFKTALSSIIGIPHGSKLDQITNSCFQKDYFAIEDLETIENEEELKSFGFKTLHINRWNARNKHNGIVNTKAVLKQLTQNSLKVTTMGYLILRDIISFGLTCKTLYYEIFEFGVNKNPSTIKNICTVYIPPDIEPHLEYFLEESLENLITNKLIHQIKRNKVFSYSSNKLGEMLTWQNHDAIDVEIISTTSLAQLRLQLEIIAAAAAATAAAAQRQTVVTWGYQDYGGDSSAVQDQLQNIKMIFSTDYAFAGLKTDGNVVTWGEQHFGGNSNLFQYQLKNIKIIFSNISAFAALTTNRNVITWGTLKEGGDSNAVQNQLKNIKMIFSTDYAFAALHTDGNVVTWGSRRNGGDSNAVQDQLQNIKMIFSNRTVFAALTIDGNVVTWGKVCSSRKKPVFTSWENSKLCNKHILPKALLYHLSSQDCGANSTSVQDQLKNIKIIFSTWEAFAALTNDGNVVTWGCQDSGGDSNAVQDQLKNIKMIFSTNWAFAALTTGGNVVTWGNQKTGGDSNAVQDQLQNIKMIFSTRLNFAALTNDGNVVTWGDPDTGGDSSAVQDQLKNIKNIFSTQHAFAALTTDGNVVTWGNPNQGGDSSAVQNQLKNIKMIFSNYGAFAALTTNGNVKTWGHPDIGGNSIAVQDQLKNIKMIFSHNNAFAAFT